MIEQALELDSFTRDASGLLTAGPGKYERLRPFEVWLATRVLGDSSWADEETGTVEWRAYYARIGRRIVSEDSLGFVYVEKYASEDNARDIFAAIETEYSAWSWDETTREDEPDAEITERAAYLFAQYVKDTDVTTARAFAEWYYEPADTGGGRAEQYPELADAWSVFVRERTPRDTDGHRD